MVDIDSLPPSAALTITETAALLHISEPTLWRWLRDRRINSVKLGSCRRILAGDIRALLAESRVAP